MDLRIGEGASAMGTVLTYLIFGAVVVAVAALMWWMVQNMQTAPVDIRSEVRRVRPRADFKDLPFEADAEEAGDPESALERALARRDWNRAVIWVYACLLFACDQAGLIRLRKGKTNRSYLQELDPELENVRRTLRDSMQAFELVYFGHLPSDEATARDLHERYQALLPRLERRG